MPLIEIALVKKHLRVFHSDEDETIAAYQAAAENIVVEYLDREVLEVDATLPDPNEQDTMLVTPALVAAVLLLVGDLYEFREADAESKGDAVLPRAVRSLLAPYRVWRTLPEGI